MERKYLKMRKNQFLKVVSSLSWLEKVFIKLKDIELKDIKVVKNRRRKM